MNKIELMSRRREAWRTLDLMKSPKKNCIKINSHSSKSHEFMKFSICWELAKQKKEYITEAVFCNNRRADIVILDDHKIVEIICSETEQECKEKVKDYPKLFEIIMVDSNKDFNEKMLQ